MENNLELVALLFQDANGIQIIENLAHNDLRVDVHKLIYIVRLH
jgi:hypothetical protein